MNRDNVIKLRDFMAALPPDAVDMSSMGSMIEGDQIGVEPASLGCGTCACVAGWGAHLASKEDPAIGRSWAAATYEARHWLGLENGQPGQLFCPNEYESSDSYTQADVVAVLTRLAETGEVVWPAPREGSDDG